uniref:Uncharacterized protein n=1 Tax=Triticum urartu TaxID=4572 RepID=A0A8R7TMF1_TRIUA
MPRRRQGGAAGHQGGLRQRLLLPVVDSGQPLLRVDQRLLRPLRLPVHLTPRGGRLLPPRRQPRGALARRLRRPPHRAAAARPHPRAGRERHAPARPRPAFQPQLHRRLLHGHIWPRASVPVEAHQAHLPQALLQLAHGPHPGVARRRPQPLLPRPRRQPPHGDHTASPPRQDQRHGLPQPLPQQPHRRRPRRLGRREVLKPRPVAQRPRRRGLGPVRPEQVAGEAGPVAQLLQLQPLCSDAAVAARHAGHQPQRRLRCAAPAGGYAAVLERQLQPPQRQSAHRRQHGSV